MSDPVLLREQTQQLRHRLAAARLRYANLLAAARATVHAADDGDPDPLYFLTDELTQHPLSGDRPDAERQDAR